MKSILKFSIFLMIITLGAFIVSCSGDGEDGKDGTNGIDGANGEPGTANVFYSAWLNMPVKTETTIDGTTGNLYNFAAPQITAGIMDSGVVLTYLKFGSDVLTLPYTSRAGGIPNTITAITSVGNLKIFRFRHDGATPLLGVGGQIRYIIIPGGTSASRQLDYRNMSYEEVCAVLDIPE